MLTVQEIGLAWWIEIPLVIEILWTIRSDHTIQQKDMMMLCPEEVSMVSSVDGILDEIPYIKAFLSQYFPDYVRHGRLHLSERVSAL